jgi:hypothetical protein
MRSHHIYARAFCRALLEHSSEPDAWYTIAAVGDRMGINREEGLALARECARRAWIEHVAENVRLREEGRKIAMQRLSFRKDASR